MTHDMKQYTLTRDGDRNLRFTGALLGSGSHGAGGEYPRDWTRWTEVDIYITNSKKFIVQVSQMTRWQGEVDRFRISIHETPEALLAWLIEDAGGTLGPASKEAWNNAGDSPELSAHRVEEI